MRGVFGWGFHSVFRGVAARGGRGVELEYWYYGGGVGAVWVCQDVGGGKGGGKENVMAGLRRAAAAGISVALIRAIDRTLH